MAGLLSLQQKCNGNDMGMTVESEYCPQGRGDLCLAPKPSASSVDVPRKADNRAFQLLPGPA